MFQARKKTFFQVFKNANVFVKSSISNALAVSLPVDIIARCVSFSSIIVDLWKVLISLNLLKLRLAVLRRGVIGKLSLEWPQAPFPWTSAEIFPGGATSTFCLQFSGCWWCSAIGGSQSALPFLHKKKLLHFMAIVTKNALRWQQ